MPSEFFEFFSSFMGSKEGLAGGSKKSWLGEAYEVRVLVRVYKCGNLEELALLINECIVSREDCVVPQRIAIDLE